MRPKGTEIAVSFVDGKTYLNKYVKIDDGELTNEYDMVGQQVISPFQNITFSYGDDENEVTVPAIVLIRENAVLYDDYFKAHIKWSELTEKQRINLFTKFVLHYLPGETVRAVADSPLTFLAMMVVGMALAKLSPFLAALAALAGAAGSAWNIVEGCKLLEDAVSSYGQIQNVREAKKQTRTFARGLALLGVEVIPVLFGLIKRGITKYNNKAIKVGENARARTQNELADIVGKNINDVGSIEGYEKFTRKDGTIGLRRQKGMTGQLDQLSVDENGIIHNVDAEKISKSSNVGKNTKNSIQLRTLSEPSSKELRKNLIATGVKEPDFPNAAHHIVAGKAPSAEAARQTLLEYGVDINDAANGVFLPTIKGESGAYHPSLHTDGYYRKVTEALNIATSKEDVIDILADIAEQLSKGIF